MCKFTSKEVAAELPPLCVLTCTYFLQCSRPMCNMFDVIFISLILLLYIT